jgi:hypothetical protein
MELNFSEILRQLGPDVAFRIINAARPSADYVFGGILPEQNRATYDVKNGQMTIRTTMAGLVGMDSPYPPVGAMEVTTFNEQTAKLASQVVLPEFVQRELQQFMAALGNPAASDEAARNVVLNFVDKLLTQSHLDTMEYLRGQCLTTGAIDWTFNKKRLQVDYGVDSSHLFAQRTGTNGYGGTASKFWTDYRAGRALLKQSMRALIAHPDTIEMIVANDANKIFVQNIDPVGTVTIRRIINDNTGQLSSDARDTTTIISYGMEGEILDPANPGETIKVPFLDTGKLVMIGDPIPAGFRVGLGSATEFPQNALPIGYTHIGPTVEGGGRPGRWGDVYTPQHQPWQVVGRAVTNGLPVIEDPNKLVVLDTEMV